MMEKQSYHVFSLTRQTVLLIARLFIANQKSEMSQYAREQHNFEVLVLCGACVRRSIRRRRK